jgi:hypothetical protein
MVINYYVSITQTLISATIYVPELIICATGDEFWYGWRNFERW